MASEETVTLTRTEYDALISRNDELEDRLAALDARRRDSCAPRSCSRHNSWSETYPCVSQPPGSYIA